MNRRLSGDERTWNESENLLFIILDTKYYKNYHINGYNWKYKHINIIRLYYLYYLPLKIFVMCEKVVDFFFFLIYHCIFNEILFCLHFKINVCWKFLRFLCCVNGFLNSLSHRNRRKYFAIYILVTFSSSTLNNICFFFSFKR